MLRDGYASPINFLQDEVATAAKQSFADGLSQRDRVMAIAIARFTKQFRSVGVGNDSFQMQHAIMHFGESADGDLTASA